MRSPFASLGGKGPGFAWKKGELAVVVALLLVAALLWAWQAAHQKAGAVAVLTFGAGNEQRLFSLQEDGRYDVDTGRYVIHLQVEQGSIRFVDSPCPDHTCEGFGRLDTVGQWAACLPAQAVVRIEEGP